MAFDQSSTEGSPVHDLETPKKGDETRWVSFVDELLGYLRSTKLGHEFHWREALLFLGDEHWIKWVQTTQTFRRSNMEDWVPTPVTNYIAKIFDRVVDMFTAGDYHAVARPASGRQDDMDRAKAGSRILRSLFLDLETADTYDRAAGWLTVTGNAILHVGWDPAAGKVIHIPRMRLDVTPAMKEAAVDPLTREEFPPDFAGQPNPSRVDGGILELTTVPLRNAAGEEILDYNRTQERDENGPISDEIEEGQVFEREVNPFGYFPQPRAKPQDVDYVVEVEAMTPDEISSTFGSKWRDKVMSEDINILGWGSYLSSQHGAIMMRNTSENNEYSLVKYFRHRASNKFEEGKYTVTVGDNLIYEGPIDTLAALSGRLPYNHIRYRIVPGELWGHGPLKSAIPLQKRINAIDSAIIHNRKTMITPKWKIPARSGVRIIEGKPGALIRWDPQHLPRGVEPQPVFGIPLPNSVPQERDQTVHDLEDIVGTMEVLSGVKPPGVDTVGQHQMLLEQATRRFGPAIKRWKRSLMKHEEFKLLYAKQYWDEVREVRVIGEDAVVELFNYQGADVGGSVDVFVEMDSEVVYSLAIQKAETKEAFQLGLLGDPRNPEVQMKVLERLNLVGFKNDFTVDTEKARRSIHKIVNQGDFNVQPMPFDIFPIHLKILSDHIKGADFESHPQDVQQALMQLAMAYQQAMQQQQKQAMMAAQATKGAGPATEEQVIQSGAMGSPGEPQLTQ